MAKIRRVIRKVMPAAGAAFDDQLWPVYVALLVLGGFLVGVDLAYLRFNDLRFFYNAWTWLFVIPIVLGGAMIGLRYISSRMVRRTMQFALVISVLIHVLFIIIAVECFIFSRYGTIIPPVADLVRPKRVVTVPDYQKWQLDPQERQKQELLKPVETETPEPMPEEVQRQETKPDESPVEPQPTPVPEQEQTVKPNEVKKTEQSETAPRHSEQQAKLSRQSNTAQPTVAQNVAAPQVSQQAVKQPTTPESQVTPVQRQTTESQMQRATVDPEPTTVTQNRTVELNKQQTQQTPDVQSTAAPTLQRQQLATPTVTPRTDVQAAETPTVAQQTQPTEVLPNNTTATKQTTASPQVTRAQTDPTPVTPTEVTTQVQRSQQPTESRPEVAQTPTPVPNNQPRTTTRPSVAPPTVQVVTPSQAPTQSSTQPSAVAAQTSPTKQTTTEAVAQRRVEPTEPTPVTSQATPQVTRSQPREAPAIAQTAPAPTPTPTRQTTTPSLTPSTTAQVTTPAPATSTAATQPTPVSSQSTSVTKQTTATAAVSSAAAQPSVDVPSPSPSQTAAATPSRQPQADPAPTIAQANTSVPNRSTSTQTLPSVTTTAANVATSQAPTQSADAQPRPSSSSVSRQATINPAASISQPSLDVPAASTSTQVAQASTQRAQSSNAPSLTPQAQPTASPSRAARASLSPASPTSVESPAVAQAERGAGEPSAEPARMALSKSFAGTAGIGQSANLDRAMPAADMQSSVASGSVQRAQATQTTPNGAAMSPSEPARLSRSQAGAATPSSSLAATPVEVATAAGSQQPAEMNASSSAALERASSNAAAGPVSAAQGTVEVDIGPTRLVTEQENSASRAAGGGQPTLNFDTQAREIAKSETGGAPLSSLAASTVAEIPSAPKASGGGEPATPAASVQATAVTRTDLGGPQPVSGGPSAAADIGPSSELSTAQQTASTTIARTEAAESAPGDPAAGGGQNELTDEEKERLKQLARSAAGAAPQLALAGPALAGPAASPVGPSGGDPPAATIQPEAVAVTQANAGGGSPASGQPAADANDGPPVDAGGGEVVAQAAVGRTEIVEAAPGMVAVGGGSSSPSRTATGPSFAANTQAATVSIAGAPQSSGSPQGAPAASQGIQATKLAGGAVGPATTDPVGAAAGAVAFDAPPGGQPGVAIGQRQSSPSAADGPVLTNTSNIGAPGRQSTTAGLPTGATAEVAVNVPQVGPSSPAPQPDMAALVGGTDVGPMTRQATGGLEVNIDAAEGPGGLSQDYAVDVGLNSRQARRESLQVSLVADARFPRQNVGGPLNYNTAAIVTAESFRGRTSRDPNDKKGGGPGRPSPQSEETIELGLVFLMRHQSPDGSWSFGNFGAGRPGYENESAALNSDSAATALSLLAFQGAGYTHVEHRYQDTLRGGVNWLVKNQKPSGDLYVSLDTDSNRSVWLYSHSIAALALCEAYGMTQDPALRQPAQKAIDFLIESQNPNLGGWRYSPQLDTDTSVTGWAMMALKSGQLANLDVPPDTFKKIERWLDEAQASKTDASQYRYNPRAPAAPQRINGQLIDQSHGRKPSETMTAVGLLMRWYSGWGRDNPNMIKGAEYLKERLPEIGTSRDPKRDTYYWYYATYVMFNMGGEYWETWNAKLHPLLTDSQVKQGPMAGSWNPFGPVPDKWAPHAGRLYVTTMNLLSLEVYWRHLPLFEETTK
jgi:hypothetical protein